jgi:hypothetical protein
VAQISGCVQFSFPLIRFLRRPLTLLRFLTEIECGESPETRLRGLNTHHGPVTAHHSPSLLLYAPSTTSVPMHFILSLTALAALVGVASAAGAPIPCTLDKDCSLGAMCAQNTCIVNYCKAHTDCAAGYFCLNGMCSIGAPGGNCYSCSKGEYCNVQSFCLGWNHVCRVDADCAKGWYCNAGGICMTQSTPSTDLCPTCSTTIKKTTTSYITACTSSICTTATTVVDVTVTPIIPVNPVYPVSPVVPVYPVSPVIPVYPTTPVILVYPTTPIIPVYPATPIVVVTPATPPPVVVTTSPYTTTPATIFKGAAGRNYAATAGAGLVAIAVIALAF